MVGRRRAVRRFYRLFLAPGTGRCGLDGTDGFTGDLTALTASVEGRARQSPQPAGELARQAA